MRNYTAKDIQLHFEHYKQHFTHVVVAHTRFRPYNSTAKQIEAMAEQAKRDCRYALNCFNKLLYPAATNKPVRKPELYRPLTLVTIEGAKETADAEQTIHFNITLGNLPKILTTEDIDTLFRHAWYEKARMSENIHTEQYYVANTERWIGYTLKEAQHKPHRAWSIDSIWDVENCWIPHAALNAD